MSRRGTSSKDDNSVDKDRAFISRPPCASGDRVEESVPRPNVTSFCASASAICSTQEEAKKTDQETTNTKFNGEKPTITLDEVAAERVGIMKRNSRTAIAASSAVEEEKNFLSQGEHEWRTPKDTISAFGVTFTVDCKPDNPEEAVVVQPWSGLPQSGVAEYQVPHRSPEMKSSSCSSREGAKTTSGSSSPSSSAPSVGRASGDDSAELDEQSLVNSLNHDNSTEQVPNALRSSRRVEDSTSFQRKNSRTRNSSPSSRAAWQHQRQLSSRFYVDSNTDHLILPLAKDEMWGISRYEKLLLSLPVFQHLPQLAYVLLLCVHLGFAPFFLFYKTAKTFPPSVASFIFMAYLQSLNPKQQIYADGADVFRTVLQKFRLDKLCRSVPVLINPLKVIGYLSGDHPPAAVVSKALLAGAGKEGTKAGARAAAYPEEQARPSSGSSAPYSNMISTSSTTTSASSLQLKKNGHTIVFTSRDLLLTGAERNFVFGCHPHGVLNLCNGTAFVLSGYLLKDVLGKNFRSRLGGIESVFQVPVLREFLLNVYGVCSASEKPLLEQLNRKNRSVALVVGGALEALFTEFKFDNNTTSAPDEGHMEVQKQDEKEHQSHLLDGQPQRPRNKMRLVLKDRKGFVRIALLAQKPLVPVLGFGENSLYQQKAVSVAWRSRQLQLQRLTGVSFPAVRSKASTLFPLIPRRDVPLTSVFGRMVDVKVRRSDVAGGIMMFGGNKKSESKGTPASPELQDDDKRMTTYNSDEDLYLTQEEVNCLPKREIDRLVDKIHAAYILEVRRLHAEAAPLYGTECDQVLEIISSRDARDLEYYKRSVLGMENSTTAPASGSSSADDLGTGTRSKL
ncbi:unnamed protein product [Amoebophrya sp. A120]|nr:unnamed protein product [Amoebophrya sp. A120]|eukprot:GSA120T00010564001.1